MHVVMITHIASFKDTYILRLYIIVIFTHLKKHIGAIRNVPHINIGCNLAEHAMNNY